MHKHKRRYESINGARAKKKDNTIITMAVVFLFLLVIFVWVGVSMSGK
jgi:hypothetical protein